MDSANVYVDFFVFFFAKSINCIKNNYLCIQNLMSNE